MPSSTAVRGYQLRAAGRFCEGGAYENIVGGSSKMGCSISCIRCPDCGWWYHYDVWYPTIDCSTFKDLSEEDAKYIGPLLDGGQEEFTPETFVAFAARLAPFLGSKRPVVPSTIFGIRAGWAIGKIGDFAWWDKAAPVVRESVFQAMVDAGFAVAGASMPYRAKRDLGEKLIHLELPPLARLAPASGGSTCELCGKYKPGKATVIDSASFNESVPLQRVLEMPGVLIVATELAEFLHSRRFSDVSIEPIEFE